MLKMDPATMRTVLAQLEQATQDQAEWHESLLREIVCGLSCDPHELAVGACLNCRFGRWYHELAPALLWREPAFAAIGSEHARLHRIAAKLLREVANDGRVVGIDYEELVAANARLGLELDSLRHELQGALRNCDALTAAYGRAEMLPQLREWHELTRRGVQQCCIVFMDVDHLKAINDTHGHQAGDQALASAVRCLTQHLRPYDKVFRYGGDEFLIVLPGADLANGQTVIKRLRERLAQSPLVVIDGGIALNASASFGLALLDPSVSVEESINRADQALLLAKAAGRNRAINWDAAVTTCTRLPRLPTEDATG